MPRYLLDLNVLQAMKADGDANVRAWLTTVGLLELFISVPILFEMRHGREKKRHENPENCDRLLGLVDEIEAAYPGRIVNIDRLMVPDWARLMVLHGRRQWDWALVAMARSQDMILVTRNVKDMRGGDVDVLNPFDPGAVVERV